MQAATPRSDIEASAVLPLVQGITSLHEAVALIEGDGRIAWVSAPLGRMLGSTDLAGTSWVDLAADPTRAEEIAGQLRNRGHVSNEALELMGPTGASVRVRISAARIGCARPDAATIAILRIDATPRRSATPEPSLRFLSSVLENAPEGVLVVDESRFVTYANPAVEELTGYRAEELVDQPLALLLPSPEDAERIAEALEPERPLRGQLLDVRRRDGARRRVSVSVSVLPQEPGAPMAAVAYVRDVTEQKRVEDDLARKHAELEHYVDAVSHDLRTPLMSLLGFSRLLFEDYGDRIDDKGRHFLRRIEEAGRSMEDLIGSLLELSRIARKGPAEDWVEPKGLLEQLHAELKPRLDAAGIALEMPADAPVLRCNRTRLYQLLSNLITNAVDHMGERNDGRIVVSIDTEPETHVVRVTDNGKGIDPAHHERVFEIFQSLGPGRDGHRGTGMGLAIVQKIAETQGGRAWVESTPGAGASFAVSLPTS